MHPTTAILIPCHNESQTVAKVIADFKAALPYAEIYVCDNGSTDSTAEIARKAGAMVVSEERLGKGYAMSCLMSRVEADIYLMVDGDDTYDAKDAARMVEMVEKGEDMVVADRLSSTYFKVNRRPFHNMGNSLVKKTVNLLFSSDVKDIMSGYRAMSRRFVKNFPVLSKGFEIETEMTIHALNYDFRIAQIESVYRNRPDGSESKLNTVSDGKKVMGTIFRLFRDYRPLVFFSTVSVVLLLLSVGFFIPIFMEYLATGLVPRFPTLIVSGFVLLVSLLLFCVGLVLEAMKNRHNFMYKLSLLHYGSSSTGSKAAGR